MKLEISELFLDAMISLIDAFHTHLAAMEDKIEENDYLDEIAHE